MFVRLNCALPILAGTLLLNLFDVGQANAALVRRTFNLNAGAAYTGSGFFDYDDATLQSFDPFDLTSNKFADILTVVFGYTGESSQPVIDPFKRINFDSADNFLGLDLLLAAPLGQSNDVLIANEDAYIPSSSFFVANGVVTYGTPTAVPTPALLPGLLALGLSALRRKRALDKAANASDV